MHCSLLIDGVQYDARVLFAHGRSQICNTYAIEVAAVFIGSGQRQRIDAEMVLGSRATFTLHSATGDHAVAGIVTALSRTNAHDRLTIEPKLALLNRRGADRVLVDMAAAEVVKTLCQRVAVDVTSRLKDSAIKRSQWITRDLLDLPWLAHILAEEGIAWWTEHDASGAGTLILADHPAAFPDISGETKLRYGHGHETGLIDAETIYAASLGHALAADCVRLRAKSNCSRLAVGRCFELTDGAHPGLNRRWLVTSLSFTWRQPLSSPDQSDDNSEPAFEAELTAVPADGGYRPALPTRRPAPGLLRAAVSGVAGSDIHTDALGRIKVRYALDRAAVADSGAADSQTADCQTANDQTSAWTRVVQRAMAGGAFVPRTGWDTLVAFDADRPDRPVALGRLDNGAQPTAAKLPAQRMRSAWGTPSTPSGGAGNLLLLDDTAGHESFRLSTAGDYHERAENNRASDISGSESVTIGGQQTVTAGAMSVAVAADQSLTVGGGRDVSAGEGIVIQCGSESVSIASARSFTVGGDYQTGVGGPLTRMVSGAKNITAIASENMLVSGASTLIVGGSYLQSGATASVSVGGASSLTVGGALSYAASKYALSASIVADTLGSINLKSAGPVSLSAGGRMNLTLGDCALQAPTIVIKAKAKLTLRGGGATIQMTPASITFTGPFKAADPDVASGMVKHK